MPAMIAQPRVRSSISPPSGPDTAGRKELLPVFESGPSSIHLLSGGRGEAIRIDVNAVCPGPTETRMMKDIARGNLFRISSARRDRRVVLFLASQESSAITGRPLTPSIPTIPFFRKVETPGSDGHPLNLDNSQRFVIEIFKFI